MKFNCSIDLTAFLNNIEIEADNEEDAREQLADIPISDLFSDYHYKLTDVEYEVYQVSHKYKVKAYNIDYDIDEEDLPEGLTVADLNLPQEFTMDIEVDEDEDLDDYIADEITIQTDWLVNSFDYVAYFLV